MRTQSQLFIAASCALLATAAPIAAAVAPAQRTALAVEAQSLVDAFMAAANGDEAAGENFLARYLARTPMTPREDNAELIRGIQAAGGLKLMSIDERPSGLRLMVAAANGRLSRIDLAASPEPGRIGALLPVSIPTPYSGPVITNPMTQSELASAIDCRVRFAADRDEFSGTVLVVKGKTVVYSESFGSADKSASVPNTAATRFNIGSMDKQFTAVAIGQLIEQGRLTLDTRLIDVLPDYPNRAAADAITIRHLLSHRAGLGMLFDRPGWEWKKRFARMTDVLPLFAAAGPDFVPGIRFSYSNEGFVVLGAVVERLSGLSWHDYAERHIFRRAGMRHTAYLTDSPSEPRRAIGYKFDRSDPLGLKARVPNWDTLSWRGGSHGGSFTTAGDMIRFLQALRSGRLLKPQTVAALFDDGADTSDDYALGFERHRVANGRTIIGHDGGGPSSGINSDAKMVLENGYAYAVLGNYDAPFAQALGRDIGTMIAAR